MSVVVAEGVVELTADAKGVSRQINNDIEAGSAGGAQAGRSLGRSIFGGVLGGFAAVGGITAVAGWFSGAVSGASDLNETMSKSQAIFGTAADGIVAWSETAAKRMGLSQSAALETASGFGNMFTQLGFASDSAADLSEQVVQMSADLGSFNNLPTAGVADRISAAFRGEYDSLQSLIPNINAARVEQEAMAATGKANAAELTAQEKAAAVLAIVNKDGAAAMGDFAKTADGAANMQKSLTASLEDQQTKLGQVLLPIWTDFLGFLTDVAVPALSAVVGWIAQNADWLGPLALGLGIATAAQWAMNAALTANPIGLVVGLIAGLVAAIVWVATQTTFFQDVWNNMANGVRDITFWLLGNVIMPVFNQIAGVFRWLNDSVIQPVSSFITDAFENIGGAVQSVFGGIGSFIRDAFLNIIGYIRGPVNTVIDFINTAIGGVNAVGSVFGVSIPSIPRLATGTNNAPDMFIAGEAGPELITGARGATVRPYSATQDILARGMGGGKTEVKLTQNIYSTDPVVGARQASREVVRYLGTI
jgi:phage-related protein